jgi:sortase A
MFMPDKRTVDELSIEELERILAIKKREARQNRLTQMQNSGRMVNTSVPLTVPATNEGVASTSNDYFPKSSTPTFDDDLSTPFKRKNKDSGSWRKFLDGSLLLVEVMAIVGLVGIAVVLLNGMNLLQEQSAEVQAVAQSTYRASLPTIAPTPTIQLANVVLPGGHTSPLGDGGGQFNFDEIPVHLREQLRDQIFLPPTVRRAEPQPETPIRVIIPDLNIDQTIVQGVDWEALKLGVGMLPNGATPVGNNENVVLAAHNDIYGEIFRYIDQLQPGMIIQIQTQTRFYDYVVTSSQIVDPDDVYVMEPRGYSAVTLISCYPYQVNNKRYIVFAELANS